MELPINELMHVRGTGTLPGVEYLTRTYLTLPNVRYIQVR